MSHFKGLKEGHVKAGDLIELGWPAACGRLHCKVIDVLSEQINDLRVRRLDNDEIILTRSLGAKVLFRNEWMDKQKCEYFEKCMI
jgi:hypothetical protein